MNIRLPHSLQTFPASVTGFPDTLQRANPRTRLILGIIAAVVVVAAVWYLVGALNAPVMHQRPPPPVIVGSVQMGNVTAQERTIGTVVANATVQVTAQVGGQLAENSRRRHWALRVLLLSLVCVAHLPPRFTITCWIVRWSASCGRSASLRRSGGNEPAVSGKPDSIRTVHCSRKSETARRGSIAGNSENVSPPSRTETIDQQAPSVNASRVCQRANPSVGNSENVVPLLRNSNSISEPPVGKGARLLGFSRDAFPGPRSRC